MECKVGVWTMNAPQFSYNVPPTFTPPRPPGRFSPIRASSSWFLLLRAAVDIEVHGGSIEASSMADHATLSPSMRPFM